MKANSKLFKVETPAGPSYVGIAGTVAHFPVLRKAMTALPQEQLLLGSKDEVFDTFTRLHPLLKGVLCLDMLMGRVEFVAILVVLYPRNWFGRRRTA